MYLLDTHTILWYLENNPQLSASAKKAIETQFCFVHIVSFWEIAIKVSIGKLAINYSIDDMINQLQNEQIEILPISQKAVELVQYLPQHHRDPFDRMLMAEASIQNLVLISIDPQLDPYSISRLW